jgi:hypothetical protein
VTKPRRPTKRTMSSRNSVRFDLFMMQVKGLAASTRRGRVRIVGRFLSELFGPRPIVAEQIKPADLRRFMIAGYPTWSAGSRNLIAGSLRGYIQFRALLGDPVQHLAFAVPAVASWRCRACYPRSTSFSFFNRSIGPIRQARLRHGPLPHRPRFACQRGGTAAFRRH